MDSYTFSCDSSSFFVKETSSDEVNVHSESSSILHLNSQDELMENENDVKEGLEHNVVDKFDADFKGDCANMASDIFIITIDPSASNEIEENCTFDIDTSTVVHAIKSESSFRNEENVEENVNILVEENVVDELHQPDIEPSDNVYDTTSDQLKHDQEETSFADDKNTENFDMEHFLSFKPSKAKKITKAPSKRNTNIIKKYFTDVDTHFVRCSLCSDILVNNVSNLLLHLRLIHRSKKEMDGNEKNAKVWNHFTKIDPFKAKCNLCSSLFIYKNRMANLVKHLRVIHGKTIEPVGGTEKEPAIEAAENEDSEQQPSNSTDLITIQNSEGKLLNQIKINKSWKCFTKLPNSDKMICNLCKKIFTHNNTSDLLEHLHKEHKSILNMKQLTSVTTQQQSMNYRVSDIVEETDNVVSAETPKIVRKAVERKAGTRSFRSNKVWEYFAPLNIGKVKCKLCNKELANNFSTSNLLRHLNTRHPATYRKIKEIPSSEESATINIVVTKEEGNLENDVTVADILSDYQNILLSDDATEMVKHEPVCETWSQFDHTQKLKPVSETWSHFFKVKNSNKVKCKLCDVLLIHKDGVSSNLTRHLKLKHRNEIGKIGNDLSRSMDEMSEVEEDQTVDDDTILLLVDSEIASDNVDADIDESKYDEFVTVLDNSSVTYCDTSVSELPTDEISSSVNDCSDQESKNSNQIQLIDNESINKTEATLEREIDNNTDHEITVSESTISESTVCEDNPENFVKNVSPKNEILETEMYSESNTSENVSSKRKFTGNKICESSNPASNISKNASPKRNISENKICESTNPENSITENTSPKSNISEHTSRKRNITRRKRTENSNQNRNISENASRKRKMSDDTQKNNAWDYFRKSNNKAICNICTKSVSYRKGSMYQLLRHLLVHNITPKKKAKPRKVFACEPVTFTKKLPNKRKNVVATRDATTENESGNVSQSSAMSSDDDLNVANNKTVGEVKGSRRTWKNFTKLDRDNAKCNFCGKVLTYKLGQTSNLVKHMQLEHKKTDEPTKLDQTENTKTNSNTSGNKYSSPVKNVGSNTNIVWKHFTKLDNMKAMCSLCEFTNILCYSKRSRSNLVRHLKRKHTYVFHKPSDSPVSTLPQNSTPDDCVDKNDQSTECNDQTDFEIAEMQSLFDYLTCDEKLKNCIKFENNQIKCKICSGSFVCDNLINYEYTIRYHVQIFHAEWTVMCFDDSLIKRECVSPVSDPIALETTNQSEENDANYNELDAIANEVNSFMNSTPPKRNQNNITNVYKGGKITKKRLFNRILSDNIWSYFTQLTSQNVRCNFCSILLSFKRHKKWNLMRHLRLKHRSKLNISLDNKAIDIKTEPVDDYLNVTSPVRTRSRNTSSSGIGGKSQIKKTRSTKSPNNELLQSPVKNIKSVNESNPSKSEKSKKAVVKKSVSSNKKSTIKKRKDEIREKKRLTLLSIETPIDRKFGRTWSHFTKIEMGNAQCNICGHIMFYKGSGIDILNDHLTSFHTDYFDGSSQREERKSYFKAAELNDDDDGNTDSEDDSAIKDVKKSNIKGKNSNNASGHEMKTTKPIKKQIAAKPKEQNKESPDSSKKQNSPVWMYFTKVENGYAKCHLCLSEISYRGTTTNLMRHLQNIHSVISLLHVDKKEPSLSTPESEKSKLLAAVNLTPAKVQSTDQLCFIRVKRNVVKCSFCPRILHHKSGNLHKLMSHLLYKHPHVIKKYKSLKHVKFHVENNEISLIDKKQEQNIESRSIDWGDSLEPDKKIDRRKIYRSNTWLYFTKLGEYHARCNKCSNVFSYKGGSIYNLTRHLLIKHDVKLIKRVELPLKKLIVPSRPAVKLVTTAKRKETLLFFKRITRRIVRCKLCLKRFTYSGMNITHLVNHLWSCHISKLVKSSQHSSSNSDDSDHDDNNGDDDKPTTEMEPDETPTDNDGNERTAEDKTNNSNNCEDISGPVRRVSSTWDYFTGLNDDDKNVKCNICERIFCFRSGNVSNLTRHLANNHNIKKYNNPQANKIKSVYDSSTEQFASVDNKNQDEIAANEDDFLLPFTRIIKKDKSKFNGEKNELFNFYSKIENCTDNDVEKMQCKICNDLVDSNDEDLVNLKTHLSLKHNLSVCAYKETDKNLSNLPSTPKNIVIYKANNEMVIGSDFSRMKCKLCYKELIFKKNKILSKLVEHLDTTHDLSEQEKQMFENFLALERGYSDSNTNNCIVNEDHADGNTGEEKKELFNDRGKLKHIVLAYYKNLKALKSKCKVCNKFISSKKPCVHRITNDLSIKYRVCKTKRQGNRTEISKNIDKSNAIHQTADTDEPKVSKIKKLNEIDYKLKNFMSVHLYENKCVECMSLSHNSYCIHSLNSWITNENLKTPESTKPATSEFNQVSLTDKDVQMITDSLGECNENDIIIITDDQDTSVLNYSDITNRNENVSYQIMNSINEIDDDDIKVIIYNYNTEESIENNQDGVKIQDVTESLATDTEQSSNKALEEHINNIVNELNAKQLLFNNEKEPNHLQNEQVEDSDKLVNGTIEENESSSILNNDEHVKQTSKSYNVEKLTELAEVSCNEQFYKQNSFFACPTDVVDTVETKAVNETQEVLRKSGSSDRCIVETIYPENDVLGDDVSIDKKCIRRSSVVEASEILEDSVEDKSKFDNMVVSSEEVVQEHSQTIVQVKDESHSKRNEVLSEEVINAIFNEVIVNLHEPPQVTELGMIKLVDDNIEMPSRLYLQKLKSTYRINKGVIYFSHIDHEYKIAKCNLCSSYLQFVEPIIYNLLMHLFTHHKDKVCVEESINKVTENENKIENSFGRPRRISPVWKYFTNEKNFRATCRLCRYSFSFKGGAINNLSRHIRLRHNIVISGRSVPLVGFDGTGMLPYPKRRSAVKLRSKTWRYFSKEPNDWAKCKICNKYLSYRSSTINNLTRHLRTIHSKIFNRLFTDKMPMFIKNEDGTLSANTLYTNDDENSDFQTSLMLESSSTKTRDEILQRCSYSSLETNHKKKSIVWNYFTEVSPSCGKCNFCTKVISCKGGGTSNLSRHLRSKHGIWIVLTSNLSHTFNETLNDPELLQTESCFSNLTTNADSDTIITQEQLHILKSKKIVHKKSKTWDYFTKESIDRVRCNLCSKPLSYKCKAVHNLRRHLAKKHPSYVVKPEPIRLKLQINTENDVLHNTNVIEDAAAVNDSNKKFIDITDTSVVIVDEENQLPPNRPDRNARPKKSIVWNYFEELEYGVAKCVICAKILSFRGGGTNNLMRHLRCRHSIIIVNNTTTDCEGMGKVIVLANGNGHDGIVNAEQQQVVNINT